MENNNNNNNNNKEDPAAPESWETADLEESVKRLLVSPSSSSSRKPASPEPDSDPPSLPPPPPPSTEDLISQVDQFLREALEKPRERISVLRMEQDIERFIRNPNQLQLEFNSLPTSYLRLAAHRLAQHYFLQSIAMPDLVSPDGSGSRIILRKTTHNIRLPSIRLADIPSNLPLDESSSVPVKLAIKPRPHKGSHGNYGLGSHNARSNMQKSVEERKEEYTRARNRIFNNNSNNINSSNNNNSNDSSSNNSTAVKAREEVKLPESLDNWIDTDVDEGSGDFNLNSNSNSTPNSNSNNNRESGGLTRTRSGNRVAIFRDREVDRKDPDYDRSYDRYAQRFDPGFGFNNGSYAMQPLYAPAVNYHTEFPQLGPAPLPPPQLSLDPHHQVRGVSAAHMQWAPAQQMAIAYRHPPPPPPEAMLAHAFNAGGPGAGGPGVRAPVYMHSPQYAMQPRPGMPLSYEHMNHQSFLQAQQQQQEGSYGMARPR
ncbi:hypothetical protein LUZ60_016050 [Juncus effusus]|nr:hypothetical protein LUZ60_016050 [Juncus effusus]